MVAAPVAVGHAESHPPRARDPHLQLGGIDKYRVFSLLQALLPCPGMGKYLYVEWFISCARDDRTWITVGARRLLCLRFSSFYTLTEV